MEIERKIHLNAQQITSITLVIGSSVMKLGTTGFLTVSNLNIKLKLNIIEIASFCILYYINR